MQTPAQTCERVLAALEELVTQESLAFQAWDHDAVRDIQRRSAELISGLEAMNASAAGAAVQLRAAALLRRRRLGLEEMNQSLSALRHELQDVERSRQRVADFAPAYGRAYGVVSSRQVYARG